jgi:hypothetical protein
MSSAGVHKQKQREEGFVEGDECADKVINN